jgi:hypothetical protein
MKRRNVRAVHSEGSMGAYGPISVVTRYPDTGCREKIDVTHLAVDSCGHDEEQPNRPRPCCEAAAAR